MARKNVFIKNIRQTFLADVWYYGGSVTSTRFPHLLLPLIQLSKNYKKK